MIYFWQLKVRNFESKELKQLLTFATYESFFIFDGEFYTQIDEVAIASLLGATRANAFYVILRKNDFQNSL